jgi:hypothetical protein
MADIDGQARNHGSRLTENPTSLFFLPVPAKASLASFSKPRRPLKPEFLAATADHLRAVRCHARGQVQVIDHRGRGDRRAAQKAVPILSKDLKIERDSVSKARSQTGRQRQAHIRLNVRGNSVASGNTRRPRQQHPDTTRAHGGIKFDLSCSSFSRLAVGFLIGARWRFCRLGGEAVSRQFRQASSGTRICLVFGAWVDAISKSLMPESWCQNIDTRAGT